MADVERIETIWREAVARSGGPFLFGRFTAADAMFAPVVNRFEVYDLIAQSRLSRLYGCGEDPSGFAEMAGGSTPETWIVPEDEA